jgi:hypothetical protein
MMEDGLYFQLPEDAYFAEPRLSASAMKWMRVSPRDFYVRSFLNPDRPEDEEDTKARVLGKAFHRRILEGRDFFLRDYTAAVDKTDYPDALCGNDELKLACKDRGLPVGGKKSQLIERLLADDPTIEIWEDIVARHAESHPGKTLLPGEIMARIETAAAQIEKHPALGKCVRGGMSEVSILWHDEETGTPCKGRLDYLKTMAIVDLKTLGNPHGKPFDTAVRSAVANNGYFVQAAMYWRALEQALGFIRRGQVYGDVAKEFLDGLLKADPSNRRFLFLFQCSGPAQVARGYVFPRGTVYSIGDTIVRECIEMFALCRKTFGDGPWVDTAPISEFEDTQFPAWIGEA